MNIILFNVIVTVENHKHPKDNIKFSVRFNNRISKLSQSDNFKDNNNLRDNNNLFQI
jgi:hypothetical protein